MCSQFFNLEIDTINQSFWGPHPKRYPGLIGLHIHIIQKHIHIILVPLLFPFQWSNLLRTARTTTTVSWITGEVGFGYITVPEGYMSQEDIARLNAEHAGVLVIQTSGTDSHMWSGATTCRFLEQMTLELRKQRRKIGCLDTSARAMLICDKCTSHLSKTFLDMRRQWAAEQNVLLVGTDPYAEVKIPGGWGLSSSPNDGWHGCLDLLMDFFLGSSSPKYVAQVCIKQII